MARVTKDLDRLLKLDHPNILKVFDVIEDDLILWIFMEYCPHEDLQNYARKRDLSFDMKLEITAADPGFPRGGRQLPRGGGAPTYDFAKFSQKLHEIERIWVPGGGEARPLRPP